MTEHHEDDMTIPPVPHVDPVPRPLRVAIDDGLAQMKLIGEYDDGSIRTLKIPTAIRSAGAGAVIDLGGDVIGMYRTDEGHAFVCSGDTKSEETRFPDFHVSQQDRVLIHNALIEAGYGGREVEVLTAMPVDEYFSGSTLNRSRIEAKRSNLMLGVEIMGRSDVTTAQISDVKVGCQGIAAYFDFVLKDDGSVSDRGKPESVAIVDIGGSTTDIAVVLGGARIDGAASGAARIGVLDVHTALLAALHLELGFTPSMSPASMDRAVRTGTIKLFGEEHDISAALRAAIEDVGDRIVREVDRRIGNAATLDAVLFVGGGAALFGEVVRKWRGVTIPKDPEFSNARGLLKYARSRG